MVEFFVELGFIGWLGLVVWIIFIATVLFRSEMFIYYEYRFPKFDMWDDFLYEEWHYYVFMVVRFIVILIIIYVITKIMFLF